MYLINFEVIKENNMLRNKLFIIVLTIVSNTNAQNDTAYLKANAVRIDNVEKLPYSAYTLLSPFKIIMFGEMHGTNESAPFVAGLANLFTNNNDSVQVGLEIPPESMKLFISQRTDSNIYKSNFFLHPAYQSGKESFAWANLLSKLNSNPKVNIFFFDVNANEGILYQRDSLMYAKIKTQFKKHPAWKVLTISGNFHNRISGETTMALFLKQGKELDITSKICSLNMEYKEGSAMANFTHGLELKQLGSYPSAFNSTLGYDRYLILLSSKSNYPYNGFYYTKFITAAKMIIHE